MIADLMRIGAALPLSDELRLIIAALLLSLSAASFELLRNRRSLTASVGEDAEFGAIFENPSSIVPHLMELRQRVILAVAAVVIATLLASILADPVLRLLAEPAGGLDALQVIRVTESFGVLFRVALVLGLILASPFVISQAWIFIAAGLKSTERRLFYWLFPFAILLFLSGVTFAYFAMLPVAVPFLTQLLSIQARPTLDDYVSFVTSILLWVGLSFEMPLIVYVLARFRLVTAKLLAKNWRIALIGITVLAAVVTPTPDPINMAIVTAPLFVLYLVSIVMAAIGNPGGGRDAEEPA